MNLLKIVFILLCLTVQVAAQVVVADGAALVDVPEVEPDCRRGAHGAQVRCVPLAIPVLATVA